jgi:hypothetical protein
MKGDKREQCHNPLSKLIFRTHLPYVVCLSVHHSTEYRIELFFPFETFL